MYFGAMFIDFFLERPSCFTVSLSVFVCIVSGLFGVLLGGFGAI